MSEQKPELRTCVVCGEKSHRADWQASKTPACDGHSAAEVAAAVKAAAPAGPVSTAPKPGIGATTPPVEVKK